MTATSYFKVALPLVSKQDTSPRSLREEYPPTLGCFPFDVRDIDSAKRAYDAAVAFAQIRSGATISVWRRPQFVGPWSGRFGIIGELGDAPPIAGAGSSPLANGARA